MLLLLLLPLPPPPPPLLSASDTVPYVASHTTGMLSPTVYQYEMSQSWKADAAKIEALYTLERFDGNTNAAYIQPDGCGKRHLFLSFPYVCPEPVLVKCSFLYINGAKMPFFAGMRRWSAPQSRSEQEKRRPFFLAFSSTGIEG
jgi:hypothetical protein